MNKYRWIQKKLSDLLFFLFALSAGVIIPGVWSTETMLLFLIAGSLVARSASDIWMIQSVTIIESTIIQMDRKKFLHTLMKYCSALPLVRKLLTFYFWIIYMYFKCFAFYFYFIHIDICNKQCIALEYRWTKIEIPYKFIEPFIQPIFKVSALAPFTQKIYF